MVHNFKGTHGAPSKSKPEEQRGMPLMAFPRVESPLETLSAQVLTKLLQLVLFWGKSCFLDRTTVVRTEVDNITFGNIDWFFDEDKIHT